MKWISSGLLVATLGITCLAQQAQPAIAAENSGLRIAENPEIQLELQPQSGSSATILRRSDNPDVTVWLAENSGCLSLRVYHFERDGIEAPRMIGETTCTPASKGVLRRLERPTEARLIPAN